MDADRAARAVVRAAEHRRPEIILGAAAHAVVRIHGIAPATTTRVLTATARLMRAATESPQQQRALGKDRAEDPAAESATGASAARRLDSRLVGAMTALNDRAARRLNQMRQGPATH